MLPEPICRDHHGGRSTRPHTHFDENGRPLYELARPRTLDEFVEWAVREAAGGALLPPSALHTTTYDDGDDPGHIGADAIVGRPFTRQFYKYLDRVRPRTPVRKALARMRARSRIQSPEYLICHAIIEDGQGRDHVQTILRCSDEVMFRALSALHELTDIEKSHETLLTGSVVQAT